MRRFLLCVFYCLFLGYPFLNAQDSTSAQISKVTVKGQLGNALLTYQFDSIDHDAIKAAINEINLLNRPDDHKIYGHSMFYPDSLSLERSHGSKKTNDNYILGQGDEIGVTIFGISQFEGKFVIGSDGFISPDKAPKILVKGLNWGAAKKLIERRFSNRYRFRSDQFSTSIISPRSISVNIFGEVDKPGSYEFSATTTAFTALRHAHGPTAIGSVRNIKVIDEESTRTLDLYELFSNPSRQFDLYLNDHTIIQIPTSEKNVEIRGAIYRPLTYELKSNEGLKDLIKFAGGFAPNAALENIQIQRFEGSGQIIIDVSEKDLQNNYPLKAGDIILIREIDQSSEEVDNAVVVQGAVHFPGIYSLSSNPNLNSLLQKAKLKNEARRDVAYLARTKPNGSLELIQINLNELEMDPKKDILLRAKDKLIVSSLTTFLDKSNISVKGAVRNEIDYPFDSETKVFLSQSIFLAGGLDPEASGLGYIIRSNEVNKKEKEYIKINISEALKDELGSKDVLLEPWDEILVLSSSTFTDQSDVSIKGEVRKPITIKYDESLKLKDLIILGGGLKSSASRKMTIVRVIVDQNNPTRTTTIPIEVDQDYNIIAGPKDFKLIPYDEVVVRNVSEFELQKYITIRGEVAYPGIYSLSSDKVRLSDIIDIAGGLTADAFTQGARILRSRGIDTLNAPIYYYVVTDLNDILTNKQSAYNHILREGDIIDVPIAESEVRINLANTRAYDLDGAHEDQVLGVKFVPNKSAKWYLDEFAGGLQGKKSKYSIVVRYANGVVKTSKSGIFKKSPIPETGSTIWVECKDEYNAADESSQNSEQRLLKKGVIINIDGKGRNVEEKIIEEK